MNSVCEENKCAGCMACVDICPKNAISVVDGIKFYNAYIDKSKCVDCNLCKKVCQHNHIPELKNPIMWRQGWSKDNSVRERSSSGGFAYELMKVFLATFGDFVCSCRYDNGYFKFAITDKLEELEYFSGSKYVKSNPEGIYKQILKLLNSGKTVLFLGLPCQVASLLNFTNRNENLYTVDLICHGSPSPKVLDSFLKSYNCELGSTSKVSFRAEYGYALSVDGKSFSPRKIRDYYTMAFADGYSLTENCYSCNYAGGNRVSDITIGDSWGSELPSEMKKGGVSLALCQTEKGKKILEASNIDLFDVDLDKAKSSNPQLVHPMKKTAKRNELLDCLAKGVSFKKAIRKCFVKRYYKDMIKTMLIKIGIMK